MIYSALLHSPRALEDLPYDKRAHQGRASLYYNLVSLSLCTTCAAKIALDATVLEFFRSEYAAAIRRALALPPAWQIRVFAYSQH